MPKSIKVPHRTFSLIELLVVIVILSLLASLLMPAVRSAREAAKGVHCVSNFRQIGVMNALFADEHNKYHTGTGRSSGSRRVTDLFNTGFVVPTYGRALFKRTGKPRELGCPSVEWYKDHPSNAHIGWNWNMTGYDGNFNYRSNGCKVINTATTPETRPVGIPDSWTYHYGTKITYVKHPDMMVDMADKTNTATNYSDDYDYLRGPSGTWNVLPISWSEWDQAPTSALMTFRHVGKASVLYIDGHAELEKPDGDLNSKWRWRFE